MSTSSVVTFLPFSSLSRVRSSSPPVSSKTFKSGGSAARSKSEASNTSDPSPSTSRPDRPT